MRFPRMSWHAREPRRGPVFWLLSGQLIMFVGIAAIFPVAPLYVAHRGGGSVEIALFIAGPLVANTLVQVPAGRLCDRIGRRPLLIGSRLAYGALSIGLFADVGPLWLLSLFRVLQGVSSGAYVPALRAALTDLSDPGTRGLRFSQMQACEMVGLLVGPALGGAAALWRDSAVFGISGAAVLLGLIPMARVPETLRAGDASRSGSRFRWWRVRGVIVPAIGLAAIGTVFSMYDVVWPQYLAARGNSAFVIGLSISLFAVPILGLARAGGRLSDRVNRRRLVPAAMLLTAACAASYPGLRSLAVILAVGTVEAVAFVVLEPTLFALIGDSTPETERGRAMGVGGFFEFGGSAFGAGLLGSLYGVAEGAPFWTGSAALVLAAIVCAAALPVVRPAPGRILEPPPVIPMREGEPV